MSPKKYILEKIVEMLPSTAAEIYHNQHCIPGEKVPCPKARDYLEKNDLLCPVAEVIKPAKKIPKKRRKKGFWQNLFG